jgi:hypothetical protein
MNRKANDTDHLKLTRTVEREFNEQCDMVDGHQIFRAFEGRHFQVEVYGSNETTVVSVRRLAYALQNPHDHVGADEEVWTTCEHKGSPQTGEGTCVIHLRKVKNGEAKLVRAHAILTGKLAEATA